MNSKAGKINVFGAIKDVFAIVGVLASVFAAYLTWASFSSSEPVALLRIAELLEGALSETHDTENVLKPQIYDYVSSDGTLELKLAIFVNNGPLTDVKGVVVTDAYDGLVHRNVDKSYVEEYESADLLAMKAKMDVEDSALLWVCFTAILENRSFVTKDTFAMSQLGSGSWGDFEKSRPTEFEWDKDGIDHCGP